MSKTDERIVKMRFENEQFERGVKETLESLGRLKKGLDLDGAAKGLNNLESAGRSFSLGGIGAGVDQIASRFSTLGIIGVTALQNITNSAINAGKRIVSALTIDPVTTGFNEYELKMGSIQTIMASTGEDLETVNEYLAKLNEYSDKTIYSFADMTQNIGKFTNAGVDLDTSVKAIQGVSNVAAVAGANSEEASRAMYNFAQALSSGYVKLIDWKSIENANMATVEFKEQLIEAALASGTIADAGDGMYQTLEGNLFNATKGFNDVLQDQWMTTDVLVNTLKKYADETTDIGKKAFASAQDIKTFTQLYDTLKEAAQSGWAQSWELIVGDFEEAKEMLLGVSNAIGGFIDASADARNAILKDWKDLGGRTELIEAFSIGFESLLHNIAPIKEAFREVFPAMTGQNLYDLTLKFKELMKSFKMEESTLESVKAVFKGMFSAIDLLGKGIKWLFDVSKPGLGTLGVLGEFVLDMFAHWGQAITNFNDTLKISTNFADKLQKIHDRIQEFIRGVTSKFKFELPGLPETTGDLDLASEGVKNFNNELVQLKDTITGKLSSGLDFFGDVINKIKDGVKSIGSGIKKFFDPIGPELKEAWEDVTFTDVLGTGMIAGAATIIITLFKKIHNLVNNLDDMMDGVADILENVGGVLKGYQRDLNAKALKNIAVAVAILAGSLFLLTLVDPEKIKAGMIGLSILLGEVIGAMAILDKLTLKGVGGAALSMLIFSAAILVLAKAMDRLKEFQTWDETWPALISLITLIGGLALAAKAMKGIGGKDMITSAIGILIFATAVKKLAKSIEIFSKMSIGELAKGIMSLGAVLGAVAAFIKYSKIDKLKTEAKTITALAISLLLLYASVRLFGQMDIATLTQGLLTVGALIGGLALAVRVMGSGNVKKASNTLTSMAIALMLLIVPIKILGEMDPDILKQGLFSVAAMIAGLTAAIAVLSSISKTGGVAGVAAALIGMSAAILILSLAIKVLSNLSWKQLAIGLTAILVPLAALTIAAMLLVPLGPGLLVLAAAFALFGAAGILAGKGLLILSVALGALVTVAVAGATALMGAISIMALGLAEVIPQALAAFISSLAQVAPAISEGLIAVILTMADTIVRVTPPVLESMLILILRLLDIINEKIPEFTQRAVDMILAFMKGITENIPRLVDEGMKMIIAFLEGMASAIDNNHEQLTDAIYNLLLRLIEMALNLLLSAIPFMFEAGKLLLKALWSGIKSMFNPTKDEFGNVSEAGLNSLRSDEDEFFNVGNTFMQNVGMGMIKGIDWVLRKIGGQGLKLKDSIEDEMTWDEKQAWFDAWEVNEAKKDYWDNYRENASKNISKTIEDTAAHVGGSLDFGEPVITPVVDGTNVDNFIVDTERKFNGLLNVNGSSSKASGISTPNKKDPTVDFKGAMEDTFKKLGLDKPITGQAELYIKDIDTNEILDTMMLELSSDNRMD
jgi:hypothetical protein